MAKVTGPMWMWEEVSHHVGNRPHTRDPTNYHNTLLYTTDYILHPAFLSVVAVSLSLVVAIRNVFVMLFVQLRIAIHSRNGSRTPDRRPMRAHSHSPGVAPVAPALTAHRRSRLRMGGG